jgi:hypothetical protein
MPSVADGCIVIDRFDELAPTDGAWLCAGRPIAL